ncbi:protein SPEAR1 isoform X3 [Rhodamnia argentea]|uniref:Protein SPEAR1 isoform X3 n=1 Tax=Rhodamnia argentea TaxID=178133 RepID=A0ABM3HBC5_9MYRT|nr:protein SPEAR1 isoform X3 [Rhodamnia argentea]
MIELHWFGSLRLSGVAKKKKKKMTMGSSFFGDPNMRGASSSSSNSTRKSKKSNSDKPKQPQRGLGVAQLEKIRLHGQMGCPSFLPNSSLPNPYQHPHPHPHQPSTFTQEDLRMQNAYSSIPSSSFSYSSSSSPSASYGFNPHLMMGLSDYERANIRYDDSQPTNTASWNAGSGISEIPQYGQHPNMTRHLLNLHVEDSQEKKNKKHRSSSIGSSSQNSEPNDNQEVDLELRLSL